MGTDCINVLTIEDDESYATLLRKALERMAAPRFQLRAARTLGQAFEFMTREPFDAVLLDLSLKETSGLQTLLAVRSRATDLPIIVLTGNENHEMAVAAVRDGAQDYLFKQQTDGHLLSLAIRYAVERKKNERCQREQLHFLQCVMDNIPSPLYIKDINLVFRACNQAFERLTGVSKEAIIGRRMMDFFPGAAGEEFRDRELKLLWEKTPQSYEMSLVLPDGYKVDMMFHETLYHRGDGEPAGMIGIAFDISERKRAELSARENENYINLLLNSIHVGVAVIDLETFRLVDVNAKAAEMLGLTRDQLAGDHWPSFFPGEVDFDAVRAIKAPGEAKRFKSTLVNRQGDAQEVLRLATLSRLEDRPIIIESLVSIDDSRVD